MTRTEPVTRRPREVWRCKRGDVELAKLRWKFVSGDGGVGEWFELRAHGRKLRLNIQDMECLALLSHQFVMRQIGK